MVAVCCHPGWVGSKVSILGLAGPLGCGVGGLDEPVGGGVLPPEPALVDVELARRLPTTPRNLPRLRSPLSKGLGLHAPGAGVLGQGQLAANRRRPAVPCNCGFSENKWNHRTTKKQLT